MFKYITYSALGKACYKSQSLWRKCPRILFRQILRVHVLIVTVSDLQLDKPTEFYQHARQRGVRGTMRGVLTGIRDTNTVYFWFHLFAKHT